MGATSTYLAEECSQAARVGCGVLSRWPWLVCAVISFIQLKMIRSATSPCDFSWFILPCVVGVCEVTFCCDGAADQAGWYCECGGHALYDVALNLVFLGLQYVTPGESVASRTRSKKSA